MAILVYIIKKFKFKLSCKYVCRCVGLLFQYSGVALGAYVFAKVLL